MFKRFTHHPDGHALRKPSVSLLKDQWEIGAYHLLIALPGGFELEISLGALVKVYRYKVLANSDWVDYNESIAADDWRDQLFRPDGRRW